MITYFLFSSMVLCYLALMIMGPRVSLKRPESLFFFLFMTCFTLFLTKHTLVETYPIHHIKLDSAFFPFHYTVGAFFFVWVRLAILPNASFSWKSSLLLLPGAIEIAFILLCAALSVVCPSWAPQLLKVYFIYLDPSLYVTTIYVLATLVFILRKKSIETINIVYQSQHRSIQVILSFIVLLLITEVGTPEGDFFHTDLTLICCAVFILYKVLQNHFYAAQGLAQEADLLKVALNETNQAVVITDANRLIRYSNQAFVAMTGYNQREVVGRKPSFLQGALTTNDQRAQMKNGLESLLPFETDIINYRKNGEAYVCRVAITPVFTNRELTHFVAFEADIQTIASPMADQDEQQLLAKIKELFEKDHLYQHKHLQLGDVAERLQISPRKLSETLKKIENCSFNGFINQYRIRAAVSMLTDPKFKNWKMEAIGDRAGFNSKASFYSVFKAVTGETPANFVKHASVESVQVQPTNCLISSGAK
jgi:PAS domain S-box-containing protein